jgi:hypothetical protein
MKSPITLAESQERISCESVVRKGQQTFIEVGDALLTLRDKRLYRNDYANFEDYCRKEFGWSASRSRQLVSSAQVAKSVTIVTLPTEAEAREMGKIPAESRNDVAKKAAESGEVTAKSIRAAARVPATIASEPTSPAQDDDEPEAWDERPRIKTAEEEISEDAAPAVVIPQDIREHMESVVADWEYIQTNPEVELVRAAALNFQVADRMFRKWAKQLDYIKANA